MAPVAKVPASFDPAYARYLGYCDGRRYGHRNPMRSFNTPEIASDKRTAAYFDGIRIAQAENAAIGLDMVCRVHWDKPGFDTPECGCRAAYMAFAPYGNGCPMPLCERHARVAYQHSVAPLVGTPRGFSEPWEIVPIDWL